MVRVHCAKCLFFVFVRVFLLFRRTRTYESVFDIMGMFFSLAGAGKTTALRIMSGDERPTSGTAFLKGVDAVADPIDARRHIGFCPQHDALFELLTAREHLTFYARIRGVRETRVAAAVDALLERLTLSEFADRPAGTYSGGTFGGFFSMLLMENWCILSLK
jgi:ABC-type Na+ transport system ATPase subunit NatA